MVRLLLFFEKIVSDNKKVAKEGNIRMVPGSESIGVGCIKPV